MATKVYVNIDGTTGYKMAAKCNAGMNEAELLEALAESTVFKKDFAELHISRCRVYMMGRAKPTKAGHKKGILLDGDATPLTVVPSAGGPPPAVYLYIDTTAARGLSSTGPSAGSGSGMGEVLLKSIEELKQGFDKLTKENIHRRLGELFVKPVSTKLTAVETPRTAEARIALKVETVDFYGLWASDEPHKPDRKVYTMIPCSDAEAAVPTAVDFSDAILSHIWQARMPTDVAERDLHLPSGFHTHPRNFLVLRKQAEIAFDRGVLLLLPSAGRSVTTKYFCKNKGNLPPFMTGDEVADMAPRTLYLPQADKGKVPFMRLLGWTAISHLRERCENEQAWTSLPPEFSLDSTLTSEHAGVLLSCVADMKTDGWRFRTPEDDLDFVARLEAEDVGAAAVGGAGAAAPAAARPVAAVARGVTGVAAAGAAVGAAEADTVAATRLPAADAAAGLAAAIAEIAAWNERSKASVAVAPPGASAVAGAGRVRNGRSRMLSPLSKTGSE